MSDDLEFPPPPLEEQERMVEAVIFASASPMSLREIGARLPAGCDAAEALQGLRARYEGRGVELVRVGDAWAFRTAGDLGFLMQESVVESRRLSRAATGTCSACSGRPEKSGAPRRGRTVRGLTGQGV